MKLYNILKSWFYQDPQTIELKKKLKQLDNKIGNSKDYNEIVILCREYQVLEEELKEHKIKMKNII
jgi:hypothetical protein